MERLTTVYIYLKLNIFMIHEIFYMEGWNRYTNKPVATKQIVLSYGTLPTLVPSIVTLLHALLSLSHHTPAGSPGTGLCTGLPLSIQARALSPVLCTVGVI